MTLMKVPRPKAAAAVVNEACESLARRIKAGSSGVCPVELALGYVSVCAAQSCGKCVPCRVGLAQMQQLLTSILNGVAQVQDLETLKRTARTIYASADCAIGFETGAFMMRALTAFEADFQAHVLEARCSLDGLPSIDRQEAGGAIAATKRHADARQAVPCRANCPAQVDIPGYIALVGAGRYADAVNLIRKDNPFPLSCGLVCEHPCELACRRGVIDDALNIRALKRYAVDHAPEAFDATDAQGVTSAQRATAAHTSSTAHEVTNARSSAPKHHAKTGKRVAIVGGGPAGLTAAYYLALMGHTPVVYEQREHLGGMMRYGIPAYRFPREELQREIDWILAAGVEVKTGVSVPSDISIDQLKASYDAVYLAIGAHGEKPLGLPGEQAEGVLSAVQMLRAIGDGHMHDFAGQDIVVVGGGNVAMDVARTSLRLGAQSVKVVYRRRVQDMTAQEEEIQGAIAEGCEILELNAPQAIETRDAKVCGLKVQPQMISSFDRGRPKPVKAQREAYVIPCDRVLMAVGQGIEADALNEGQEVDDLKLPTKWGKLVAGPFAQIPGHEGVFCGGDCESGPATVIRAIAAGKAAAHNIDEFLGFNHKISVDIDIPQVGISDNKACGRSQCSEREAADRKHDFAMMEIGLSDEEAAQEASRCLRCDRFGFGSFCGGRTLSW